MDSNDIGDASEAIVLSELTQIGYTVSIPFSDSSRYDLVVEVDGDLEKVQVKTGRMDNGCVTFQCRSKNRNKQDFYTPEEVDAYCVYSEEQDSVYWILFDEAGKRGMRLRVDEDIKNSPQVNWARDFLLQNRL